MTFLPTVLLAAGAVAAASTPSYTFTVAQDVPSGASIVIPEKYMSLSIEVSSFARLGGSPTAPEALTINALQHMYLAGGAHPDVRITGMELSNAQYSSSAVAATSVGTLGNQKSLVLGPDWFDYFSIYPNGSTFTIGLNLNATVPEGLNMPNTSLAFSEAIVSKLASKLTALEFGNEPDMTASYTGADYTTDFLKFAGQIKQEVLDPAGLTRPMFAFGTLAREYAPTYSPLQLAAAGSNSTEGESLIQSFSNHKYPYNNCGRTNAITTSQLMDHKLSVYNGLYNPIQSMPQVLAAGFNGMILGEVNSITCGQEGVANSYASALWMVDYAMFGAANNITRMYVHFGDFLDYAPWFVTNANSLALGEQDGINPIYYGMLLVAEAIGSTNDAQVKVLNADGQHIVYGVWSLGQLQSAVVINNDVYNDTSATRGSISVQFNTGYTSSNVTTKLLTGANVNDVNGVSYAGNMYNASGVAIPQKTGLSTLTTDSNGGLTVQVSSSQVMLVIFNAAGTSDNDETNVLPLTSTYSKPKATATTKASSSTKKSSATAKTTTTAAAAAKSTAMTTSAAAVAATSPAATSSSAALPSAHASSSTSLKAVSSFALLAVTACAIFVL